ncbi:META domain-containing protein [Chryseobacterium balustinum]|uniref:Heat shock protein HslJ n=2 Tax=Chryseobacterium balustinum TaxID=246 RepID=A0AAX2IHG0_9FLAO|nr:META domain-containing protein [Chryseobacterium balustinum]SKB37455.1 heat shock protein HslJ [Chryseobacterium balustinum]SQA88009.1 META domain [Chryseobacterium balustinum]
MKNILSFLFAFFILNLVINCSVVKSNNEHYQREWMMVSFDGFTKEQLVKNLAEINLTEPAKDGKIRGTAMMGCNRMFFTLEFKSKNRVKISGLGSTLMACQEMNLETEFSKVFEKMTRYEINGHFLTLYDENGTQMKFIAADWD